MNLGLLIPQMLEATLVTLKIFCLTLIFSLPLGLVVAFGRMSKYRLIRLPIQLFLLVMRGTPLILQLLFVYFGPYYLFGLNYDRFIAVIVGFSLNYAAYFAEIYRSGIESIPRGQHEAAKVLGLTPAQTFFRIILPQVIKRILPPMGSEFMTLIKDTALAQVIGVSELFRLAQNAQSRAFSTTPIIIAGVFYLVMNSVVEQGFHLAEKRMNYYR